MVEIPNKKIVPLDNKNINRTALDFERNAAKIKSVINSAQKKYAINFG